MKIGIYGGAFNPPHKGHFRVMEAVIDQLGLDELWMIPTGEPPHKELPAGSPSGERRCVMVDCLGDMVMQLRRDKKASDCKISSLDLEIKRSGKSFTVDTLRALRESNPEDEFWLVMGEDMLMSFSTWVSPEEVASMAYICGFLRCDKVPSPALEAEGKRIAEVYHTKVKLIAVEHGLEISSTQVRQGLQESLFTPYLLPSTMGQILTHGLYGVERSLEQLDLSSLRYVVWGAVKFKRVAHIAGVEYECAKLARRWGEDEHRARRAGVLHDLSKYWSHQEHLDFCDKYQEPLTELERSNEKLLHAKSGAVYAREILKEEEAICMAIDCHTTGKANMTTLDKILYIADYIERNRDFPELEEFRVIAYEDLDGAMGFGLGLALAEMEERGKTTHENSVAGFQQYGKKA